MSKEYVDRLAEDDTLKITEEEQARLRQEKRNRINNEITNLRNENNDLNNKLDEYVQMKNKVNIAKDNLETAKTKITNSKGELEKAYVSQTATEEAGKIETEITNIGDMIARLNNPILNEIEKKILEIEEKMTENRIKINNLKSNLMKL